MPSLITKWKKGRPYLYWVRSARVKGQSRIVEQIYLGPQERVMEHIRVQRMVPAGGEAVVTPRLGPGRWRLRLHGEKRYGFISKGRNLVWALVIQALLNDDKLHQYLEDYGTDLKVGPDLRERLSKIATSTPVLSQAIALAPYREQLRQEKFSFLRTNAFFRVCRNIAADRFDWAAKKL